MLFENVKELGSLPYFLRSASWDHTPAKIASLSTSHTSNLLETSSIVNIVFRKSFLHHCTLTAQDNLHASIASSLPGDYR